MMDEGAKKAAAKKRYESFLSLDAWARHCLIKAMFLKFFSGAYSSADYDILEEDERDVLFKYIDASERAEQKTRDRMRMRSNAQSKGNPYGTIYGSGQ